MSNKIAIIIPYFGNFPEWISIFVEGCRRNSFIDFIIFSDDDLDYKTSNIIFHKTTFEDYCKRIGKELSIDFSPKSAYKLCGVRPFYGYIHRKELESYDFWGFCDLDLVFGDLSKIFSTNNLLSYDIISTDWDRISGPLCILRNNQNYRNLAFKIKGWEQMLSSEKIIPLDEKYLSDIVAIELKALRGIDSRILRPLLPLKMVHAIDKAISMPVHFYLKKKGLLFTHLNCSPEIGVSNMRFVYDNHIIKDRTSGKELPYLHFLFFKKNMYREKYLWKDNATINTDKLDFSKPVYIDEKGIYNKL